MLITKTKSAEAEGNAIKISAEAEKEAARLRGQGVALFRQEVARGMTEAAEQMKQANQLWVQPFFIYIFLCNGLSVHAQQKITPASIKDKMQWFADAKLGIFIHAGIYSVDGIDESWSFYNKKINETYFI